MTTTPPASFDHLIHWGSDLYAAMSSYEAAGLATHAALTMPGFRNGAWGIDHEIIVDTVRFEDQDAGFTEVFLPDTPGHVPFFIAYDPPRQVIAQMRADHRAAQGEELDPDRPDLSALLVASGSPEQDAQFLADLLQIPADGTTVPLPGAAVRFIGDAPEGATGLYGLEVTGLDELPVVPHDIRSGHFVIVSDRNAGPFHRSLVVSKFMDQSHVTVTSTHRTVRRPGQPTEQTSIGAEEVITTVHDLGVCLTAADEDGLRRHLEGDAAGQVRGVRAQQRPAGRLDHAEVGHPVLPDEPVQDPDDLRRANDRITCRAGEATGVGPQHTVLGQLFHQGLQVPGVQCLRQSVQHVAVGDDRRRSFRCLRQGRTRPSQPLSGRRRGRADQLRDLCMAHTGDIGEHHDHPVLR